MKRPPFLGLLILSAAACAAAQPSTTSNTPKPDVVTTLSGPADLQVGRSARWVLSVTNTGHASALQTRTTIVLPAGMSLDTRVSLTSPNGYLAVPKNCSYVSTSRTLTCAADNIATTSDVRTFNLDLQAPDAPAVLTLTASTAVVSGAPDANLANNSATASTLLASFTPSVTFPLTGARMWMCPGKRELLECPTHIPNWALDLDANGQMVASGVVRLAASSPPGSGSFVMQQYGTSGQLTYSWNLTPYSSRCFQGPVTSYVTGDPYPYEGRVCW